MDIQQIRNVGIIAHGGAGKTTLAETLLFDAKATDRMGKVDDGSSNFDYDPEEIRRKITISTSFHHYVWDKVEVTLADTPGYINFEADTRSCLKVLDGAILVVNAVSGVEVQTEKMWSLARAADVPVIAFVSKMDRERANFSQAVADIQKIIEKLKAKNIGVLISDHNVRETLSVCGRAYIVNEGKVLVEGTPEEIAGSELAKKFYFGVIFAGNFNLFHIPLIISKNHLFSDRIPLTDRKFKNIIKRLNEDVSK